MNVSLSYALHTLWRNRTRTLVSLLGLALGGSISLLTTAWLRGESSMLAKSAAMSGQGYLQVVPATWKETRDSALRIQDYDQIRRELSALPEVTAVAPQVEFEALLGMGTKVQGVSLLGVEPAEEKKVRRAIKGLSKGRYLSNTDKNVIVLGGELAQRLGVNLDDEVVVTTVKPDGDMNSALLAVVGLIESGSKSLDATIAHVPLATAVELAGRQGVSRLSLLINDPLAVNDMRPRLEAVLRDSLDRQSAPPGAHTHAATPEVLTWTEVSPSLVAGQQMDAAFGNMMIAVVCVLVVLGITSTQLTGVLQRGREFSVLLALGMKRSTLWRLVFTEAALTGLAGGTMALLVGLGPLWYMSRVGVDISKAMGQDGVEMSGVLMDPILKADVGPWVLVFAFDLSLFAALLGAIYPVLWSLRLDPASTLRSRN